MTSSGRPTLISVHVRPNSRVSTLCYDDEREVWQARLRAAPVDGRANEELIALVAAHFGCRKAEVSIRSGASRRTKLVRIEAA